MIKISDEDIMSFVKESFEKEAKERGLVQEQEEFDDTCGDIRNFPKFEINPNWGRTGKSGNQLAETEMVRGMFASIDRVQGRDEVGRYTSGTMAEPYQAKIQKINSFFRAIEKNEYTGNDPMKALSYITIIDGFSRLMNRELTNPQAAGRLAEAFFSAIFEFESLRDEKKQIADVKLDPTFELIFQKQYSLKFLSSRTSTVLGGSLDNLISYFDNNDKFRIILMIKYEKAIKFRERVIQRPRQYNPDSSKEEKIQQLSDLGIVVQDKRYSKKQDAVVPSFRLRIAVGDQYDVADLLLPDLNSLRKVASLTLKRFNSSMSQVYNDLEHIKCYCNRYFVKGDSSAAEQAKQRTSSLKSNIDNLTDKG